MPAWVAAAWGMGRGRVSSRPSRRAAYHCSWGHVESGPQAPRCGEVDWPTGGSSEDPVMDLQHFHDLPAELTERPLLDGDTMARVIALLPDQPTLGPARATFLLCHPDGRLRRVARMGFDIGDRAEADIEKFFTLTFHGLVGHTFSIGVVVLERAGAVDLTPHDLAFAHAVSRAAGTTGFRLLGFGVAVPGGTRMVPFDGV